VSIQPIIGTAHAEVPPWVEYELSELAVTLVPHAVALAGWVIEHNPEIDAHREVYDAHGGRGADRPV
jgi:DNA-binding HxlR family transcriptional regulator